MIGDPPEDLFDVSDVEPSKPKPERKLNTGAFAPAKMARVRVEVSEMMRSGEWGAATARHFVDMYLQLHAKVYGAEPTTTSQDRVRAALLAGMMLRKHFGGDPQRMAAYVRWTWMREHHREQKRRGVEDADGFRLGWRLQFGGGLLDDYRVAEARARSRGPVG